MTTIETIRAEIERRYNEMLKRAKITDPDYWNGKADAYRDLLSFLDTLESEKPMNLEEAAKNYAMRDKWTYEHFGDVVMKAVFFGAKWQEEQDQETIELAEDHAYLAGAVNEREKMMKGAVEGEVKHVATVHYVLTNEDQLTARLKQFQDGDKVRIIIVKEDEK